jgi:hypothetical protein
MTWVRRAWVPWLLGGSCALAIVGMALWGDDRQGALAEYVVGGVMKDTLPSQIRLIEMSANNRPSLRYVRASVGAPWQRVVGEAPQDVDAKVSQKLGTLLMLLHNSAPERAIDVAGSDLASFGLLPAQTTQVSLNRFDGSATVPLLTLEFGAVNPMGLSHYVRVTAKPPGKPEVLLLPKYVGEAAAALWPPA